ncbi:MAG: hypothetical protein CM1200mP33_1160 [Chloroflexota bacterium]|nr:MAG: hypothetical protein CM1200mP33_1160 [Chloroflexota bacterium]
MLPFIRLVKGAYAEHSSFQCRTGMKYLIIILNSLILCLGKNILKNGLIPSFATHDHQIIYSLIKKINKIKNLSNSL